MNNFEIDNENNLTIKIFNYFYMTFVPYISWI